MRRAAGLAAVAALALASTAGATPPGAKRDAALAAWSVATGRPVPKPARSAPSSPASCNPAQPVHERLITHRQWLSGVAITEYYSTAERWFRGVPVHAPGIPGRHRVDWLYSARGVAMEGDGIALDGRHYHFAAGGSAGWVNPAGVHTRPGRCASRWSHGLPEWLEGGWRNRAGAVTYPLQGGGWSNGPGRGRPRSYRGVTFAPGSSVTLVPYRTVAVDPRLIPQGSRIYIPAYRRINGGWFVAGDTGGAIIGRHIDVYRPPPASPSDGGRYLRSVRVYVVPPGH